MITLVVVFILSGILFSGIAVFLYRFSQMTINEWTNTQGTIVGYNTSDYSSWVTPLVRFCVDEKYVVASASSIKDKKKPAVGTSVAIAYRKNLLRNGRTTYQTIIYMKGPESKDDAVVWFMFGIGVVLLIVGIVLCFL